MSAEPPRAQLIQISIQKIVFVQIKLDNNCIQKMLEEIYLKKEIKFQDGFNLNYLKVNLSEGSGEQSAQANGMQVNKFLQTQCKMEQFSNYDSDENNLLFNSIKVKYRAWEREEIQIFKNVYMKLGPSWKQIANNVANRSPQELKNWFGNSLRKLVAKLDERSRTLGQRWQRKNKNKSYLSSVLKVIQQAQRYVSEMCLTLNQKSNMIKFKNLLLGLCFSCEQFDVASMDETIKLSYILGEKLKCLGVFKVKNRNSWKLSFKSFANILIFDSLVKQSRQEVLKMKAGYFIKVEELNEGPYYYL